jgi:hypothetical protein
MKKRNEAREEVQTVGLDVFLLLPPRGRLERSRLALRVMGGNFHFTELPDPDASGRSGVVIRLLFE